MKSIHSLMLIMIGIFALMLSACSTKDVTPEQVYHQDSVHIQQAYLYDAKKQKEIIAKNQADNRYTRYVSDKKQFGMDDYFNINIYAQVQQIKRDILAGIANINDQVPVDCDDTEIQMQIGLIADHFPADQLSFDFYITPSSDVTTGGEAGGYVGHAVAIVDVEGDYPQSLEDISITRYQKDIEEKLGYYCVAYCLASDDFATEWKFIDLDGYQLLMNGEISLQEAKRRMMYQAHTRYTNTIFHRKDYE